MTSATESVGGVLALFGGSVLLAMSFFSQCAQSVQAVEAQAFLGESFAHPGVPQGWDVKSCEQVPDGRIIVQLKSQGEAAAPFEASPEEVAALAEIPTSAKKWDPKPWEHLQQLTGLGPSSALLVQHPVKTSMDQRKRLFLGLSYKEIEMVSAKGESLPLNGGRIPWGPYEVPWVHLRHFEMVDGKPTFHDTLRVDLSSGPKTLVLHLAYPPRARASESALKPFLAAWTPLEVTSIGN